MKRKKVESYYISPQNAYSFAFKLKIVQEVESGLISKDGARRKYGIGGKTTVLNWCRQYGTSHKKEYRIMKITRKEMDKHQSDKEKIKELEAALAEAPGFESSQGHLFSMSYGDSHSALGAIVPGLCPEVRPLNPVLPLFLETTSR